MMKVAENDFSENPVFQYAAIRHLFYGQNKTTEILANYDPRLNFLAEWWKQLYGESEGKENKGIFPASVSFTTDLHSLGQYVQEGLRNIFETVISIEKNKHSLQIPKDEDNFDKLNYLAGKPIDFVNKMAELGTTIAHVDGNVPNIKIILPEISAFYIGEMIYFFEKACAISGYLLNVNPFDQPGVEAYKKNMFALLEKPGFEEQTKNIKKRIN
jgi:glucose-6-phosphate isomerase